MFKRTALDREPRDNSLKDIFNWLLGVDNKPSNQPQDRRGVSDSRSIFQKLKQNLSTNITNAIEAPRERRDTQENALDPMYRMTGYPKSEWMTANALLGSTMIPSVQTQIKPSYQKKLINSKDPAIQKAMNYHGNATIATKGLNRAELVQKMEQVAPYKDKVPTVVEDPFGPATKDPLEKFMEKVGKKIVMEEKGQEILDNLEDANTSPASVSDKFWSDTFFKLPAKGQQNFTGYLKRLSGMEPGDVLAVNAKTGEKVIAEDWAQIANELLPNKVEYLEGTERGFVALMEEATQVVKSKVPGEGK